MEVGMNSSNRLIESLKKAIDNHEKVSVIRSDGQNMTTRLVSPYYLWVFKTEVPIQFMRCYPEKSDRFEDWDFREITDVLPSGEKIEHNISAQSIHYGEDICEIIYPRYC